MTVQLDRQINLPPPPNEGWAVALTRQLYKYLRQFSQAISELQATGGGGGYSSVEDEGSGLTARSIINFTGAGVTATDVGSKTVVNIPGGGGGSLDDVLAVRALL